MNTRKFLTLAATLALAVPGLATAQAARFPDQPIRMIVPFAPGGGVDSGQAGGHHRDICRQ